MKKYFVLSLMIALVAFTPAMAQMRSGIGIAAIVNDEIITTGDVNGRYAMAVQGANLQPDEKTRKELQRQTLDSLIDEQIRLQEAHRLGITPAKAEIDESFDRLAAQNNFSPEQFKEILSQTPGVEESLRRQLKTQLAWANVVKRKIRPQITVSETDINAYLEEQARNPAKVEYLVAEIFLKNNDNNRKLAQRLIAELKNGKRFSVLARQFSQGLEASKGGVLGWIPEKSLESELDKAIATTPLGQISGIITSTRGLHVLMIRDKRDILPPKEASQRLKMKQLFIPLPPEIPPEIEEKAAAHAKFFQNESRDCKAMDEVIKKVNSPTSRDLGEVRLADLPPAAIRAVKNLPIGKAAEPIRTPEGYAIFMVCGKGENSDEMMREDIGNLIGTERLNRLQYRHHRDLRASAYVDIK